MEVVRLTERPALENALLIAAFAGWNDAAEVATTAVRFLIQQWQARRFAEIDPEPFYVFTETRPHVRLVGGVYRQLVWPANEFYYQTPPRVRRDLVLLVGIEPHLRWRDFAQAVLTVARQCQVTTVVLFGGLLAAVPHTRPVRVTGSATTPDLRERLRALGVETSRYEGPTGIVGVLNDACRRAGIPALSCWGNVPHYLSATPNPRVALALLQRLDRLFHLAIETAELAHLADRFDEKVSEAVRRNPEVSAYLRDLEAQASAAEPPADQPTGEESSLFREIEQLLRREQDDEGPSTV